jgi:hypothetical protein
MPVLGRLRKIRRTVPDRSSGHVNVVCVYNILLAGSGCGGEGRARDVKAIDFMQGT